MSIPFERAFPARLDANEIRFLPILPAHLQQVVSMPFRAVDSRECTAKVLGPDGAELGSVKFQVEIAK